MYEDYMQNLMGFPNTYDEMNLNPNYNLYEYSLPRQEWRTSMSIDELENCYPEIYKIVYPMVRKRCMTNSMPITKGLIDNMVDEIISHIEQNNGIQLNINLNNGICQNRDENSNEKSLNEEENRIENRQFGGNTLLRDIVRILLLRELTGRPGFRPGQGPRPPFPPYRPGPRPPYPGPRPPMPRYDECNQSRSFLARMGNIKNKNPSETHLDFIFLLVI